MNKLFTIAGTSTLDGVNTFRFATGKLNVRTAKLKRHGHTDVDLVELPRAMTKQEAVEFLIQQGREAVVPTNRKSKPVELTEEQKAAAKLAAKRAADAERKRAKRAAEKAARLAAQDANYLAGLTGGEQVPVPEVSEDDEAKVVEVDAAVDAGVNELLAAVAGDDAEGGVDHEREVAARKE
jgi:hypothetical protein